MWLLLKTEMAYHKRLFFGFFITTPIIAGILTVRSLEHLPANFWAFLLIFLMLQNWIAYRNKEHRERIHALLPVSPVQIATLRLLMIFILAIVYVTVLLIFIKIFDAGMPAHLSLQLKGLSVIFGGFAIYFLIRDHLMVFLRNRGISKNNVFVGLMLILLGLNLLGILAFVQVKAGLIPYEIIDSVMYFIVGSNPFAGNIGIIKFAAFCFAVAGVTILSYQRRKSFLE